MNWDKYFTVLEALSLPEDNVISDAEYTKIIQQFNKLISMAKEYYDICKSTSDNIEKTIRTIPFDISVSKSELVTKQEKILDEIAKSKTMFNYLKGKRRKEILYTDSHNSINRLLINCEKFREKKYFRLVEDIKVLSYMAFTLKNSKKISIDNFKIIDKNLRELEKLLKTVLIVINTASKLLESHIEFIYN